MTVRPRPARTRDQRVQTVLADHRGRAAVVRHRQPSDAADDAFAASMRTDLLPGMGRPAPAWSRWLCPSPRTAPARTRYNWRAWPAGRGKRVNLTTRIAVIGVGNEFRHDDGVGWAVVARLAERAAERPLPGATALRTCDGDPARLITLWEDLDLAIVVDAARAHPGHPGRLHRLKLDSRQLSQTGSATSSHGLGLGDAVELARELDRLPGQLVVYAIEGADSSLGTGLSAHVAAIVEPLTERIAEEIALHVGSAGSR